jgi:hypothetical protein
MRNTAALLLPLALAAQVTFEPHVIDGKVPGGYAVHVADINKDGRPDVVGLTQRVPELAWHENPGDARAGWQRHVIARDMRAPVNLAIHDTDGDGIPEIALQTEFSMVAAKSPGLVWIVRHQGDPRALWKAERIDALITSHHAAWADVDGDGRKELINAPLIGPNALAPKYEDHVPLVFYRIADWKRHIIDDKLYGVLHRVRPVRWDDPRREALLTAGFDGVILHRARGSGDNLRWERTLLSKGHEEPAPRAGTSDVGAGRLGNRRFLAAVEPWHGNEVVVYTESAGRWQRRVIFDQLQEGHEIVVADFDGDGRDDLAAGDRRAGNVHAFFSLDAAGARWRHEVIDAGGMAGSGCVAADVNSDRRPDIVCIGSSTANIKWYENRGR